MKVIGIVGGIASGKSFVSEILVQLGAKRLDADAAGHQVLQDSAVMQQLRDRWGDSVFDAQGGINRQKVAEIVFAEGISARRERTFLESVTHPRIRKRLENELKAAESSGAAAVVLDAALLLESGWSELCDSIWLIDTPEQVRIARAKKRGWTEIQWRRREASQAPIAFKREQADVTIDNSGSVEATRRQVLRNWDSLFTEDLSN